MIKASRLPDYWPAAALALLTLLLGCWHLDHGLPAFPDVDAFKFVDEAARMASEGSLRPERFQHPPLYAGLLAMVYYLLGLAQPFERHLAARLAAVLAGSGLIAATYFAARTFCGRPAAALAAALTLATPLFLTSAKTAAPDTLLALFMAGSLGLALRLVSGRGDLRLYAAAGACAGAALSAKFTGLVLFPFLAATATVEAVRTRRWSPAAWSLLAAYGVAAAVFLFLNPYFLSHLGGYARSMQREYLFQSSGMVGHVQGGWLDYLLSATPIWEQPWTGSSLLSELGWPAFLAGLGGTIIALMGRRGPAPLLCALYAALFVAAIARPGHVKTGRYLLPLLPAAAILAAWFLESAVEAAGRARKAVLAALAALLLASPVLRSGSYLAALRGPTTTETAQNWMRENLPPDASVFAFPLFIDGLLAGLPFKFVFVPEAAARLYGLPVWAGPNPEREPVYDAALVDQLRRDGVRYVLTNSYVDASFSPVRENLRWFPRSVMGYEAFQDRLSRQADVVFSAEGLAAGRIGPDIVIYRMRS